MCAEYLGRERVVTVLNQLWQERATCARDTASQIALQTNMSTSSHILHVLYGLFSTLRSVTIQSGDELPSAERDPPLSTM